MTKLKGQSDADLRLQCCYRTADVGSKAEISAVSLRSIMRRPARHTTWSRSSSTTLPRGVTTSPVDWRQRIRSGVRADVPDGRTGELKSQMLRRIMQDAKAGGAAGETVWVYLSEILAENVAGYGRVLASAKYGRTDSLSCGPACPGGTGLLSRGPACDFNLLAQLALIACSRRA
jgi:hypothetical protein